MSRMRAEPASPSAASPVPAVLPLARAGVAASPRVGDPSVQRLIHGGAAAARAAGVLMLQRQIGNHALARIVQGRIAAPVLYVQRQSDSVHDDEASAEGTAANGAAACAEIIAAIETLIEALAGRLHDLQQHGGGDAGHRQRFQNVQQTLRTLMVMAQLACHGGEYDPELQEEAEKWANKPLPATAARREGTWEQVARWAREVYDQGLDAGEAAIRFLRDHPELTSAILLAGAAAIALLLADDATLVGIADDVLIPILAALEWAALRMSVGF
ncbi:hypothetical protein CLD22_22570 [Rubrivivax gelatinosus]|nr:hypothetical protein [Rubrivivax gelatinosus]